MALGERAVLVRNDSKQKGWAGGNENVTLKRGSQVLEEMRRIQDPIENKTSNTMNRTRIEPNIHEYVFFH